MCLCKFWSLGGSFVSVFADGIRESDIKALSPVSSLSAGGGAEMSWRQAEGNGDQTARPSGPLTDGTGTARTENAPGGCPPGPRSLGREPHLGQRPGRPPAVSLGGSPAQSKGVGRASNGAQGSRRVARNVASGQPVTSTSSSHLHGISGTSFRGATASPILAS